MKNIFDTIEKYHMIEPGMCVIAGVSGGADSVCLLYSLKQYQKKVPFHLVAVHVEHGIRGSESLADAAFAEQFCKELGIVCEVVSVNVPELVEKSGLSVEEVGRRERYRIFDMICQKYTGDRIAVAHNRNDQAETMLWNLVRGSGLKGLGGIRPVRGKIIRPLLFTERSEIETILNERGISWRTDGTNLEQEYTRNRIRLSLIPWIERELNMQAGLHIAQAAERLQQVQDYLDLITGQAAAGCMVQKEQEVELLLEPFLKQNELIQKELLKRALELTGSGMGLKDISQVHLEMLLQLSRLSCGKECHIPGIRAVREQGIIRFSGENGIKQAAADRDKKDPANVLNTIDKEEYEIPVPGMCQTDKIQIRTELMENSSSLLEEIRIEKKYTKWISYDTIKSNLCLRKRRAGDYLVINDSGGHKKLKEYFIETKIPKEKRDDIWLLADGSHILWIVGYRISYEARVTQKTGKILKIQIEEIIR